MFRRCAKQWGEVRARLEEAGYEPGPQVGATLHEDGVWVTEGRTGVFVGVVPPRLVDPDTGEERDLRDPALMIDEERKDAWTLLAWYYLTGQRLVGRG